MSSNHDRRFGSLRRDHGSRLAFTRRLPHVRKTGKTVQKSGISSGAVSGAKRVEMAFTARAASAKRSWRPRSISRASAARFTDSLDRPVSCEAKSKSRLRIGRSCNSDRFYAVGCRRRAGNWMEPPADDQTSEPNRQKMAQASSNGPASGPEPTSSGAPGSREDSALTPCCERSSCRMSPTSKQWKGFFDGA